jgi:hypothetical protein
VHPDEFDAAPAVEEVLVLRVVSAAQRRRVRRAVVAGLLVIVAGGGVAIGMTHRSGALPIAASTPGGGLIEPAIARTGQEKARAEIYAVARARYASAIESARVGGTHLEFGRLNVSGDRATLQVNFVCLPLCGHGEELILADQDGTWRVIAVRQTWLS